MESSPRPSIAPLVIIALAVLLIVAMICGTVIWVMQRTMSLNEKFLDARLAEATRSAPVAQPVQVMVPAQVAPAQTVPAPAESTPAPKPQPKPAPKVKQPPQTKPAPTPAPSAAVKPAPAPEAKPAPAPKAVEKPALPAKTKREAPTELPAAKNRLGPDGAPLNRISLPVGNDELEWQL